MQRLCFMRPLVTLQSIRYPRANYATTEATTEAVVLADDGTVVCWHPERPFLYEFTKPLPAEAIEDSSLLNSEAKKAINVFRKPQPETVRHELAQMTFTTKHRWYPRSRDKRAKNTAPDREYL